ncbi:hypothetical protein NB311A_12192 [Nitrobacter sp. Nb-311A]|uniref:hypothetical protein n=1 Tax=Nitrobacter sp. Nb-311A TaxID=314253 RepID=UPI00006852DE|nr:hypothetical protein [Nitrobacter sp. Nb-311A]EAQ34502.1 hypothetical protein NB311A_12192 [Nitrobacter sp. Nb-311A]
MNDETLDALRSLLTQMRGDVSGERGDHLNDANRLIKAFMQIADSESRQKVIETAERFVKKQA